MRAQFSGGADCGLHSICANTSVCIVVGGLRREDVEAGCSLVALGTRKQLTGRRGRGKEGGQLKNSTPLSGVEMTDGGNRRRVPPDQMNQEMNAHVGAEQMSGVRRPGRPQPRRRRR